MGSRREFPVKYTINVGDDVIVFHVRDPGLEDLSVAWGGETPILGKIKFVQAILENVEGIDYQDEKGEWKPLDNTVKGWKDIVAEKYPDLILAIGIEYKNYMEPKQVEGSNLFFGQSEPTSQEK